MLVFVLFVRAPGRISLRACVRSDANPMAWPNAHQRQSIKKSRTQLIQPIYNSSRSLSSSSVSARLLSFSSATQSLRPKLIPRSPQVNPEFPSQPSSIYSQGQPVCCWYCICSMLESSFMTRSSELMTATGPRSAKLMHRLRRPPSEKKAVQR